MTAIAARAPTRSRICQLIENHKEIDQLICQHPSCPRSVSRHVDRLLFEAEAIRDFYLNR